MKKNIKIIFLAVILTILALLGTLDRVQWEEATYTVKSGDTLWGIAQRYCPDTEDCREWISDVQELNGLSDCRIYAGDRLIVLVPCN